MTPDELKTRTKRFALRMLTLADSLPNKPSGRVLANQIAKCGTSTAANYRAACKARSHAEFISKLGIAEEEADESEFWLELAMDHGLIKRNRLVPLHKEAGELTAILAASRKTAAARRGNRQLAIGNRQSPK
jgi:four helix bundle protein